MSNQLPKILAYYDIDATELTDIKRHDIAPDAWAETFSIGGDKYIIYELEYAFDPEEGVIDYELVHPIFLRKLEIRQEQLTLIKPQLEQMQTRGNAEGSSINGFKRVYDVDSDTPYKNPLGLDDEIMYTLFKIDNTEETA